MPTQSVMLGARLDAAQATVTLTKRSSLIFMREVSTTSPERTHWRQSRIRQFVAVDIVAKVEHVQLCRLCRKWGIFVDWMLAECWTSFRLSHQCIPALSQLQATCYVHQFKPHRWVLSTGVACLYLWCSVRPGWPPDRRHYVLGLSVRPSVRPSVRSSVAKVVNMIFWKRMNRFRCKLAQVIHGASALNVQPWSSWGQRSRSREAEIGHKNPYRHNISRTIRRILIKPDST